MFAYAAAQVKKVMEATCLVFAPPAPPFSHLAGPNATVFAYAAAQVKKAMEVTQKLGGLNYVFWGGERFVLGGWGWVGRGGLGGGRRGGEGCQARMRRGGGGDVRA